MNACKEYTASWKHVLHQFYMFVHGLWAGYCEASLYSSLTCYDFFGFERPIFRQISLREVHTCLLRNRVRGSDGCALAEVSSAFRLKLLGTSASLLVTSALLVVTRSY